MCVYSSISPYIHGYNTAVFEMVTQIPQRCTTEVGCTDGPMGVILYDKVKKIRSYHTQEIMDKFLCENHGHIFNITLNENI